MDYDAVVKSMGHPEDLSGLTLAMNKWIKDSKNKVSFNSLQSQLASEADQKLVPGGMSGAQGRV